MQPWTEIKGGLRYIDLEIGDGDATIFVPLTFVAGIYGMNFSRMPESSWGYPFTLAAMVLIAAGQLVFFYKRGWFG